jgi:hypothetical protein
MGSLETLIGPMPHDLLAATATVTHPALRARVEYAIARRQVPSLIVTGADAQRRSLTAAAYIAALDAAGVLAAADARWVDERSLPELDFDRDEEPTPSVAAAIMAAGERAQSCAVLVISEIGESRSEPVTWVPEIFGYAPDRLLDYVDRRHRQMLPTVLTSGLPVGNPPTVDLSRNDPTDRPSVIETPNAMIVELRGPNLGLQNALEDRAAAGWQVPSAAGGYDPDALLVETGTTSLQVHLGGKAWWRIYESALATAVSAEDLVVA